MSMHVDRATGVSFFCRRTNNHRLTFAERLPKIKRYFATTQRRVANSCNSDASSPWGLYPKKLRCNVDQVPCEWGLHGKTTLEFRMPGESHTRVQIDTGRGDADQKRWVTLQVCAFNLSTADWAKQPKLTICFRGKAGVVEFACAVKHAARAWS